MRLIGHLKDEAQARTFGDYLAGHEIKNLTEPESDGTWAVWIYSEDHLEAGREAFNAFAANPADPKFKKFEGKAAALEEQEHKEQTKWEKRVRTKNQLWSNANFGRLTMVLIGISVLVYIYEQMGKTSVPHLLMMSQYYHGLPEIKSGQVWRLITPIFLHNAILPWGIFHILFNMLWLKDLGTIIEMRQGTLRFGLLVLVLAVTSNLGQYWIADANFRGMSGVVYGLFGYVWIRAKTDPFSNYYIHPNTVSMMLVWFFLCLFGIIPHIANGAHAVGLIVGALLGYWPVLLRNISGR